MHPIIARFGPVTIYSYGLMIGIAFLSGIYVARLEAIRKGIKIDVVYDAVFYLVIGALIGARIYYLAFFEPAMFIKEPLSIFKIWQGGIAIHGAILGGILAGLLFSKFHHNISFFRLADLVAPSLILGQAVGRIGCFLNGCCSGKACDLPWAVQFPETATAVHPTQLYESAALFLTFAFLYRLHARKRFDGQLLGWYLVLYPGARFVVEFVRYHSSNAWLWQDRLSDAQGISLALVATGAWLLVARSQETGVRSQNRKAEARR